MSYENQKRSIRLKIKQAMKRKSDMGKRLLLLRRSKVRQKSPKQKANYAKRIKTMVINVEQLTKRTKSLRQQLKQLSEIKS